MEGICCPQAFTCTSCKTVIIDQLDCIIKGKSLSNSEVVKIGVQGLYLILLIGFVLCKLLRSFIYAYVCNVSVKTRI